MVLRFWNRLDLLQAGVDGVSTWLDQWYAEDPDRNEAWALRKREAGDQGQQTSEYVDRVPLGGGNDYLSRVKVLRAADAKSPASSTRNVGTEKVGSGAPSLRMFLVCLGAAASIGIVLLLIR
jgi:hypothetical protein